MPNYRRVRIPGVTYFFTVVTYKRRKILTIPESRQMLRAVINEVRQQCPFTICGWVLLPDHIHCIWTLPENDGNYSKRWGMIKAGFSKRAKNLFHRDEWLTDTKRKYRESTIWQRRFWEHMIRDEDDFRRHMDYLHWNPVKHGLVKCVKDWPYSTFHRFVKNGFYPKDWGGDEMDEITDANFGE
jgi:putative transposase